jgi:FSR family fosmidomycin resistance protein-like MFS transporter
MGLTGFLTNFYALAFLIGLSALGSSIFHPSGASLTVSENEEMQGRSMALFSVSGNLGAALSPILIGLFISAFQLRSTVVLIPISILAGVVLLSVSLQTIRPNKQKAVVLKTSRPLREKSILVLAFLLLAVMLRSWFYLSFQTYLPAWVESIGRADFHGEQALFILMFSVGIGSLLGGWLSDRLGHWAVFVLGLGALAPIYWSFIQVGGGVPSLIGVGVFVGFTFPTSIMLAQALWPRSIGLVSGIVIGFAWVPGGIGSSVTGMIADHSSLIIGLQLLVVSPILATACSLLAISFLKRD